MPGDVEQLVDRGERPVLRRNATMRSRRPSPIPGIVASVSASAVLMSTSPAGGAPDRGARALAARGRARRRPAQSGATRATARPAVPATRAAPRTGTTTSSPSREVRGEVDGDDVGVGPRAARQRDGVADARVGPTG